MYQTRSYNKRMNVWYAYEVEYVWDELKQKKIQKRRCVGKIDPVTDQVIPNGKRGPARITPNSNGTAGTVNETNQSKAKSDKPQKSYITRRKLEAKIQKLARTMADLSQQIAILSRDLDTLTKDEEVVGEQTDGSHDS